MDPGIREIPLHRISPNLRLVFSIESIMELCQSIASDGQTEPIRTWLAGERMRILDGEKRWRACKMLGMLTIKAIIVEPHPVYPPLLVD